MASRDAAGWRSTFNLTQAMSEKFYRHHHRFRCIHCGAVVPSCSYRLIIKVDGRIVFLNACEINWIEADDKYVHIHIGEATHMLRKALGAIEAELDPNRFVRIHRSAIVNVEQIKELQPSERAFEQCNRNKNPRVVRDDA